MIAGNKVATNLCLHQEIKNKATIVAAVPIAISRGEQKLDLAGA